MPSAALNRSPLMCVIARGDLTTLESWALVLEAVDIDYRVDVHDGTLCVGEDSAEYALEQLQLYQQENSDWPMVEKVPEMHPLAPPTILIMGLFALFFLFTGPWVENNPWFVAGAVDAEAVGRGEWWRLITGLTLHADGFHLLGNSCLGGILIHQLSKSVGYGLAWALLITTGTLGNWCNVALRNGPHLSVGFSTAVFATVGILAGMQLFRHRRPFWKDLVLPLGAGLALLALLGTEGERTDLGAHCFGFLSGLGGGLLAGSTPMVAWCRDACMQRGLFFGMMLAVFGAWWFALR